MHIIQRPRWGQRILAILVCLVTAVLAVLPSVSVSFQSLVSDTVSYLPGTVLEVVEEKLTPSDLKGGPQLGEQTLTIELRDGSQITLTNYLTNTHNILAREGMRVVVCVDAPGNVEPYYTLYQYDRSVGLGVVVAIFLLLMLLVGGEKGFYAALALAFSLVFLLKITVPVIYSGGSPILAGLAMVLVSTAVTVFLIYGAGGGVCGLRAVPPLLPAAPPVRVQEQRCGEPAGGRPEHRAEHLHGALCRHHDRLSGGCDGRGGVPAVRPVGGAAG